MSIHTRQDLERLSRFARRRFSHALMSDTKWHKLFAAVRESDWQASLVTVKFIESEGPEFRPMRWPGPNSFWAPFQWIDTPEFGPIELRSIEWILIPAIVIPPHDSSLRTGFKVPQNLVGIRTALSEVGQFPLEDGTDGLKIIGYR